MHQQSREDLIFKNGQNVELNNCSSVYVRITLKNLLFFASLSISQKGRTSA